MAEGRTRFCARWHWIVIGIWLVILIGVLLARRAFGRTYANNYGVPGSPSDQANDVLAKDFPGQSMYAGQIVFAAPAGARVATESDAVNESVQNVAKTRPRAQRDEPLRHGQFPDGREGRRHRVRHGQFDIATNTLGSDYLGQLDKAVAPARNAHLTVEYGGSAGQIDMSTSNTTSEIIGLSCALVLLLLAVGTAVSVLIDASLVRMVLVPSVMSLLGTHAWWIPRWLDRVLPHLDIEGPGPGGPAKPAEPETARV